MEWTVVYTNEEGKRDKLTVYCKNDMLDFVAQLANHCGDLTVYTEKSKHRNCIAFCGKLGRYYVIIDGVALYKTHDYKDAKWAFKVLREAEKEENK